MYIYFCENCRKLEAFDGKTGRFICPDCGKDFLPLSVSVEDWNSYSNDEMLYAIRDICGYKKKDVIWKNKNIAS